MRYNVHSPCAFRNRIARYLGVLVGAALVATLGLPSAAQAQTIPNSAMGIVFTDTDGFTVNWTTRLAAATDLNWIVTFTPPSGPAVVVDEHTTNERGIEDADAAALGTIGVAGALSLTYDKDDVGTWWVQVDACLVDFDPNDSPNVISDKCPAASLEKGTAVGYTHGPFPAPENLSASPIPTGVALTWTSEKSDHGFVEYKYSMNADAAEPKWEDADKSGIQPVTAEDGEHTFSVRALGESDNDRNTTDDGAGEVESLGMVASVTITVGDDAVVDEEDEDPVPTPTLPEIAALLLGTLLLGSGGYLLRRRQSGGLTSA